MPFQLAVVANASHWDLVATGELDLRSGRDLIDAACILASYRAPVVELDLGDITFVDTAGWRALDTALDHLAAVGSVAFVRNRSQAMERFERLVPTSATQR